MFIILNLQLGEVADFESHTFNLALMFIKYPNINLTLKPPFCYTDVSGSPIYFNCSVLMLVFLFVFSFLP